MGTDGKLKSWYVTASRQQTYFCTSPKNYVVRSRKRESPKTEEENCSTHFFKPALEFIF